MFNLIISQPYLLSKQLSPSLPNSLIRSISSLRLKYTSIQNWQLIRDYINTMKYSKKLCFYRDGKKSHLWGMFSFNTKIFRESVRIQSWSYFTFTFKTIKRWNCFQQNMFFYAKFNAKNTITNTMYIDWAWISFHTSASKNVVKVMGLIFVSSSRSLSVSLKDIERKIKRH